MSLLLCEVLRFMYSLEQFLNNDYFLELILKIYVLILSSHCHLALLLHVQLHKSSTRFLKRKKPKALKICFVWYRGQSSTEEWTCCVSRWSEESSNGEIGIGEKVEPKHLQGMQADVCVFICVYSRHEFATGLDWSFPSIVLLHESNLLLQWA